MDKNDTDTEVVKSEEAVETEESTESTDTTSESYESQIKEMASRLKRAEARIEKMKVDAKVEKKVEAELTKKIGELDNADYALLATKGIDEDDPRIEFLKDRMQKWNTPLRELLKDDYIQQSLKNMKVEGDVSHAMPTSTRRAASSASDQEDFLYRRYMQSDELPKNISTEMREKLVNRRYKENDPRQNPF